MLTKKSCLVSLPSGRKSKLVGAHVLQVQAEAQELGQSVDDHRPPATPQHGQCSVNVPHTLHLHTLWRHAVQGQAAWITLQTAHSALQQGKRNATVPHNVLSVQPVVPSLGPGAGPSCQRRAEGRLTQAPAGPAHCRHVAQSCQRNHAVLLCRGTHRSCPLCRQLSMRLTWYVKRTLVASCQGQRRRLSRSCTNA